MLPNLIYVPFTQVEHNYYTLLKLMKENIEQRPLNIYKKITLKSVDGAF
jgi:hypothetical protein